MLSLRQIEILRAVILCETTAAAGRRLGMSQPAVSNALRRMEALLQFQLFERINNRLYPLDAAKILLEESDPIFATLEALNDRIEALRDDRLSRLRILSTGPLGMGLLPRVLKRFAGRHAGLSYRYDIRRLSQVVRGVQSGAADIGFGIALDPQPDLVTDLLHAGRMVCVCRPEHPLAARETVRAQDIDGAAFIALDGQTTLGRATRDAFRAADAPFAFSVEVSNTATACALVEAGFGAALVDPWTARQRVGAGLAVRPFGPEIACSAYALWSERRPMSRVCAQFLGVVRRAVSAPDETAGA